MAAKFKIVRHYHGKQPVEITEKEARASLAGYYPDLTAALRSMWNGEKCQTMGGWYWIER